MRRTHIIDIYRPPVDPADPYAAADAEWTPAAEDVSATLQPLTGTVQQTAAGRQVDATWRGFVDAAADVHEDDGVIVRSGEGPARYRVRQVGERGDGWDTEVLLAVTAEQFG